ncbi:GNAT family N-acetyltransferase [Nocardioides sp. GCM10027113]|uniref:GNAT family N-acetyltransferase n=1 Tax=unclassified Nocardioides TaxID=2615069 RepID=UPI003615BA8C
MSLPGEVATLRLRLPLVTRDERDDMLAGRRRPRWHPDYPREDDRDAASMIPDAGPGPWHVRHVVRAFDGLVVGTIGFFGPPTEVDGTPEAEVGFGLVEDARGHGAATEALRGLLGETDRLGVRVRASVRPENAASLRVLAKCGFTGLRGSNEDGELVMVRPLAQPVVAS